MNITGGHNFDYPYGVAPATGIEVGKNSTQLHWRYNSLESGIVVGAVLPTMDAYDNFILTMVARSIVPFAMFLAALIYLCTIRQIQLKFYETYIVSLAYGFFYVLLAYLAAFMNFYVAFGVSLLVIGVLLIGYLANRIGRSSLSYLNWIYLAFLIVPSTAVLFEGYTGLIYCIEVLSGIVALMIVTSRPSFNQFLTNLIPENAGASV
jgi:inner membrane protein involved in colicin E2 resistance